MTNDFTEKNTGDSLPEENAAAEAVIEAGEVSGEVIREAETAAEQVSGETAAAITAMSEDAVSETTESQDSVDSDAETEEAAESSSEGDASEDEEDSELQDEETKEERRLRRRKELVGDIIFFIVSFIVIFTVFKIFPPYRVSGDSMNMTLKDKAFGFGTIFFTPEYGDIVVLHGDEGKTNESDFIKRVIGKPGDVLDITDGVVVRNGEELKEDYVYFDPDYSYRTGMTQHIELGEGEYLVLGDNRYHSMDGRYFGAIKKSEMKCKMLFFLWGKKR